MHSIRKKRLFYITIIFMFSAIFLILSTCNSAKLQLTGREINGKSAHMSREVWLITDHIRPPFLHAGIKLNAVCRSDMPPGSRMSILVSTEDGDFILDSMNQMNGYVDIANTQSALHFVRMRTALEYSSYWITEAYDIMNTEQIATFSVSDFDRDRSSSPRDARLRWKLGFGTYGVLSPMAYRIAAFSPPLVTKIGTHFQIIRWVCVIKGPADVRVQRWKETVSVTGAYHLLILTDEPAPELPYTHWGTVGKA